MSRLFLSLVIGTKPFIYILHLSYTIKDILSPSDALVAISCKIAKIQRVHRPYSYFLLE